MLQLEKFNKRRSLDNSVLTFGNFDGLHLGHQKVIEKVKSLTAEFNTKSVVLTFSPNTKEYLNKTFEFNYILNLNDKKNILDDMDIDILCVVNFDDKISNISPDDFMSILIKNIIHRILF